MSHAGFTYDASPRVPCPCTCRAVGRLLYTPGGPSMDASKTVSSRRSRTTAAPALGAPLLGPVLSVNTPRRYPHTAHHSQARAGRWSAPPVAPGTAVWPTNRRKARPSSPVPPPPPSQPPPWPPAGRSRRRAKDFACKDRRERWQWRSN